MMFRKRFLSLILALTCFACLGSVAYAAQVDCDAVYCFTSADFSWGENEISGICITQLPDAATGTVMLGNRVIRQGDILTAQQVAMMTFAPLRTEENQDAVVTYLPIYDDRVEKSATMTISIRGKQDKAPVAEDFATETYKNLSNQGKLKASDPEGEQLTYTLVRQPKRGEVTLTQDGSFTYTPKKNKVGVDSFTYTAADPAGNVSREATVTITIMKPTDSARYTDTAGKPYEFAAEWMKNTGLFVGEKLGGKDVFQPEKEVSRGQFLAMLVDVLEIPMEEVSYDSLPQDSPDWLKPYLAAAMRAGLTANLPDNKSASFEADSTILEGEAAVMVQNALDLPILVSADEEDTEIPAWAQTAISAMADNGIALSALEPMTRGEAAQVLYQISKLAPDAPGMTVIRMQQ